jgi:3-hydroxybutyryl-CoA dehydrogenase
MEIEGIKTIAVIGAGTMGQGIAQVCAAAGFKTLLFDADGERTRLGLLSIGAHVQKAHTKGRMSSQQKHEIEKNVMPVFLESQILADLVIEAVVEKLEVKQELFRVLEKMNGSNTIFATNTSSISVTQIASAMDEPGRCVGLHFFNPADKMKLVEIIVGAKTTLESLELVKKFSEKIGKIAVAARDSPGFIVNRVARHFYLESLKLLEEQAAGVEAIDGLLRSAGFKMGPFELMDLIGVDINYAVTLSTYQAFSEAPRFKPNSIQEQMVKDGHLGRKTRKGFYDY